MDVLHRGVLAALAYADTQDFPLTSGEVWRWWQASPAGGQGGTPAPTREAIGAALEALRSAGQVATTGGFWHLPERAPLVPLRLERHSRNERKWQRAERAARGIAWVPFVRLVAVCNTVAISNAKPDSDIDVFIVARRGRLWLTRLLVTAAVAVRGLWRHGTTITDRICLSFFVTDRALDLRPLLLQPDDPYFAHWVDQLVPMVAVGDQLSAVRNANPWVRDYLPNAFSTASQPTHHAPRTTHTRVWCERRLSGRFGDALEQLARSLQRGKMRVSPNAVASGAAVVTDDVLKFHENDRRAEFRDRFHHRLRQLLIEVGSE